MSPVAMPVVEQTPFSPLIDALRVAPTAPGELLSSCDYHSSLLSNPEAKGAADRIAREVSKFGLQSLEFALC